MQLSIHDLTRRSTSFSDHFWESLLSFNSRPHKEVDLYRKTEVLSDSSFNSRPHKEVDMCFLWPNKWRKFFQFTTSQGGRLIPGRLVIILLVFQFTTSQGGRQVDGNTNSNGIGLSIHDLTRRSTASVWTKTGLLSFQFTTSQGGRHVLSMTQ